MTKKFKLGPNQQKFLRALKSGKYRQTQGRLARKTYDYNKEEKCWSYCCLGVACELFKSKLNVEVLEDRKLYNKEHFSLPSSVRRLLKMRTDGGQLKTAKGPYSLANSLIEINDHSDNFDEVINVIENYPEAVFSGPA